MLFPTYMKRRSIPVPELRDDETRYVLADNGVFLERQSSMFATSIRVAPYDLDLEVHREYCQLKCGRIPSVMHRAMLGFFKYAHEVHGGEAALVLLFHPEKRRFRWHCPEQFIEVYRTWSGWAAAHTVEFQHPVTLPKGYVHFGDAHLHVGDPAPSAMDVLDDQDGLHIIVGTILSTPTYHIAFVMDGKRFRVPPEAIFEDPRCRPFDRPPQRWLQKIRICSTRTTAAGHETSPQEANPGRAGDNGWPQ